MKKILIGGIIIVVLGGGFVAFNVLRSNSQTTPPLLVDDVPAVPVSDHTSQPTSQAQEVTASTNPQSVTTPSTKYLLFQLFSYSGLLGPSDVSQIDPAVQDIVNTVGTTGTPGRKIGFVVGPLTFDHTNAELIQYIDTAFTVAEKYNVAVMFHTDESMFWANRADLTSQHGNIEWTDWSGTASGPRIISWYHSTTLAPPMCFNSPGIHSAISTLVRDTIGSEIKKNVDKLNAKGKSDLFAGVIVGWETQISKAKTPVGYCALTNLGYSAAHPPSDMDAALIDVVHDFIQFWNQQFIAAGIDRNKLYTHIGIGTPGHSNTPSKPLPAAFNDDSHAGFSVYGTSESAYQQIYTALASQSDKEWGISEGSNLYPPNAMPFKSGEPDESMEKWLAQAYNHGAVYVDLFGWQAFGPGAAFHNVLVDPMAIAAYQKFLQGGMLQE